MAISTQYDGLFRRYGGSIPVAYLRALSWKESRQNPRSNAGTSKAQGLLQITTTARNAFNQANGTSYSAADTLDPELNVKIGTDLLKTIVRQYGKRRDANLREDWNNPEFVRLVTAGWNAGYSAGGGVLKVASYLNQRGLPVTLENVIAAAPSAGAVSYLNPTRAVWHRAVADLYFQQPDRGSPGFGSAILVAVLAWSAYRLFT